MSDKMTPIPFENLLNWIFTEKEDFASVFDVKYPYVAKGTTWEIFGRKLETIVGPAAGPHTQLAQNIIASYYAGSRFFELKTVQTLDGDDLHVAKPCIKADDECYNCEWSTELYVPEALAEYIKAYVMINLISKEFGLGEMDGFQFNMSCGYDLEGIKSAKIDNFIETLKNASKDETFINCKNIIEKNLNRFKNFKKQDLDDINPQICNSITLSTLHGCPPQEIERIATYLISEKKLNTFIKCNPTLLGYEYARETMNKMGYDYMAFGDFHFKDDLQWKDAVPMLERLIALADSKNLAFGVKITNTFPVDVKQNELPSEEMYMSGKALFPLSIKVAEKLAKQFDGKLRISYCGGADYYNIKQIADAGIWPITVATTLLKAGGYQRIKQLAEVLEDTPVEFTEVNPVKTLKLAQDSITDRKYIKAVKPLPSRKIGKKVPLSDCFIAPCRNGCPIHQDITLYMQLTEQGKYEEALEVITDKNPLPWITGTICPHNCQTKCTRNFYEEALNIRNMKLLAAKGGYDAMSANIKKVPITSNKKVAVIGGGPAGLATAYFIRRSGFDTTIFEKNSSLGGVVKHVIPEFRISTSSIENDVNFVISQGVNVKTNVEINDIEQLKKDGYSYVIIAIGAHKPGILNISGDDPVDALSFLKDFKKSNGNLNIGKTVAVIGGGNTAMDTARAVKKTNGVEKSYLLYRRTKRYMPADEEELLEALNDGVEFKELLSPVSYNNKVLICEKMQLGETDSSGRRGVKSTGEKVELNVDTLIAAVGENLDLEFFKNNSINLDEKNRPLVNDDTFETSNKGIFLVGDCLKGPATVVEAIANATKVAKAIVGKDVVSSYEPITDEKHIYNTKGILKDVCQDKSESNRCLNCAVVCENCVEVCPNRANTTIKVPTKSMHQIIHVDYMCNECGNCESFCPYDSAPYKDKFTLFSNVTDFENSKNQGFVMIDDKITKVRYFGNIKEFDINTYPDFIEADLVDTIKTVVNNYSFMLI